MFDAAICVCFLVFGIQAIRAKQLISSVLWLAGVSALLSIIIYRLGAYQAAVIELSVGAGLVTVLFVFAISIAGDETQTYPRLIPLGVAAILAFIVIVVLAWFILAVELEPTTATEPQLGVLLYQQRGLDLVVQLVLIFAGTLGLLGLLAEASAPLQYPAAREVAAARQRDLDAMTKQSLGEEAR